MEWVQAINQLLRPEKIHGVVFDGAFIFAALLFLLGGLDVEQAPSDRRIAALLGVAVVAQIAGASIKTQFLQHRLPVRGDRPYGWAEILLAVLLFLHFLLFTVAILMGLTMGGIYLANEATSFWRGDAWIAVSLVLGAATTGVVAAAGISGDEEAPAPEAPAWLEFIADAFLLLSVWILTWLFWELLIVADLERVRGIGFSTRGITLMVATSLLFIFFYLPARFLFLVEDYQSPFTWLRVWLAMWPIYLTIIIG